MKELIEIQRELKAPKNQKNSHQGYMYRSCEDILEAVKPLCIERDCLLTLSDEMVHVGDRYYIKATATIAKDDKSISVSALAREQPKKMNSAGTKEIMDHSQLTGSASSYARKYSLNGLFCIDDTKDADTMDNSAPKKEVKPNKTTPFEEYKQNDPITNIQKGKLKDFKVKLLELGTISAKNANNAIVDLLKRQNVTSIEAETLIKRVNATIKKESK